MHEAIQDVLSLEQERMWFLSRLYSESAALHEFGAVWLDGPLDLERLKQAAFGVAQRHEILRTRFIDSETGPRQVVFPAAQMTWRNLALKTSDLDPDTAALKLAQEEICQPLDLGQGPLWRLSLIQISSHRHLLVLTMHHIISDGERSIRLFFSELAALYEAAQGDRAADLAALPIQYRNYSVWQHDEAQRQRREQQLAWWKGALSRAPFAFQLPISSPRPPVQTFDADIVERQLPNTLVDGLYTLGAQTQTELFIILLAALQATYHRYSGQEEILIGTPLHGRDRAELTNLIGYFGTPVALRASFREGLTFRELITQLRDRVHGARENGEVSFKDLVEALAPVRNLSHPPLVQTLFLMQEAPQKPRRASALTLTEADVDIPFVAYEQVITAAHHPSGLSLRVKYSRALFQDDSMSAFLAHWETMLRGAVADPDAAINTLPLLAEPEQQRLLFEINDTKRDYGTHMCLHELIELRAQQAPEAVAISFAGTALSYAELDERAKKLARYLGELGVKADTIVAICMERSIDMVVAILGVLKAGGAYLPLDASYPRDRLAFILADTQAAVLISQSSLKAQLPAAAYQAIFLDESWPEIAQRSAAPLPPLCQPHHLAYVIYTSGSTGRPKGVLIEHRNAVNLARAGEEILPIGKEARVLQFASPGFDACTWELIMALTTGATLVIPPPGLLAGAELGAFLKQQRITAILLPPSVLAGLIEDDYPDLKVLIAGGEACAEPLVSRWANGRHFINAYGPTECTVCSTLAFCHKGSGAPAIGAPLPNVRVYVLDAQRQPVPVGVPGELYIGGAGVSRGYLGRDALNQSHFLPDWISAEQPSRLYRTGDLVRWRSDGKLEFVGRRDRQIKLRGFRIELGEIEAVLRDHPAVQDAAVLVHADPDGDKRILAYAVLAEDASLPGDALPVYLRQRLPAHMIPSAIIKLAALPLTASGKVDHAALPRPDVLPASSATEYVAPRNPSEEQLVAIWQSVLSRDRIGVHDNFFALGGHSLRAAQVVTRLRQRLNLELSLREFFAHPTVAGLAAHLFMKSTPTLPEDTEISVAARRGYVTLSFAQERLYFIYKLAPQSTAYSYPVVFRIHGPLDIKALERSFALLIKRHESLRTSFTELAGRPVQVIAPSLESYLEFHALPPVPNEDTEETLAQRVRTAIAAELQRPFDLQKGPLFRVRILRISQAEHILLLNLHHIVTDGWSMEVLYKELAAIYGALCEGREPSLPPMPIQYGDYAEWNRKRIESGAVDTQLAWWRERLRDANPVLELLPDRARPAVQSFRGAAVPFALSGDETAMLRQFAAQAGVTPTMLMLAALYVLLYRYTGQSDLLIGVPHAGRDRAELEGLVGFFVNTLVVRCNLAEEPSFAQLLAQVRDGLLEAVEHAAIPFERLVQALQIERDLRRSPLVQVMFAPQVAEFGRLQLNGLSTETVPVDVGRAPFDLTLYFWEGADVISGSLEFNSEIFMQGTAEQIIRHYCHLLVHAVRSPKSPISKLPLLPEAELRRIVVDWNNTHTSYPRDACVHTLFEEQAQKRPDATAAVFDGVSYSYAELNQRANLLAYRLMSEGLSPGDTVGLFCEKSLHTIVAMLGILKAGGAFVPLDPSYPEERLRLMLAESRSRTLVSSAGFAERLQFAGTVLDVERIPCGDRSVANPPNGVTANGLAYIMFTSGSTGVPQAVAVPHRSIVRLVLHTNYIEFGPSDRVLHSSNQSFDASTFEVWGALLNGGCVVIPPREVLLSPQALAKTLQNERITVLFLTTAVFHQVARECPKAFNALHTLLMGGEVCDPARIRDVLAQGGPRRFLHVYGPTENTTFSTYYLVRELAADATTVPIGTPISNSTLYILDRHLQPVPPGVAGEIYVGGDGVALGYANSQERTALRFIPDPFAQSADARLYKTGDLGRFLHDGNVEFLGRNDLQVKIRGFRIELGEIESALFLDPEVRAAAVVTRKAAAGGQSIVAYVVPKAGLRIHVNELRSRLKQRLPDYMLPATIVLLESLPLNPNGKVDKRALPDPTEVNAEAPNVENAPASVLEKTLASIWGEVLGLSHIDIDDLFFDLGGHSLLLAEVQAKIKERLNLDVSIVELFQHPSIRSLSRHLSARAAGRTIVAHSSLPPESSRRAHPRAERSTSDGIAIVGLAGRFPGAENVKELWELLSQGREGLSRFTREELQAAGFDAKLLDHPGYVPVHGAIKDALRFDAEFFGYSVQDARLMDPQQRMFLECAWAALEDAGYDPSACPGVVGVFGGASFPQYWMERVGWQREKTGTIEQFRAIIGNSRDFLASRISYKLGLRGPAVNVQAACATSLLAVHMACQSLLTGQCDMALAGGVRLVSCEAAGYIHEDSSVLSPDGHCRPFDAAAAGFVPGSGVAMVVLKRLADALADGDTIRGVILGSAVNSDGRERAGYTAPSVDGQSDVIARAQARAGVSADSIGYVEAHGTATELGDLVEVSALKRAFLASPTRVAFCALGSIKGNLGHLDSAAGVTGLIKTVLAMENACIPPTLHFERPSPSLELASSPFFVPGAAVPWPRGASPRRAGISAFGLGGTNVHVILEEPPVREQNTAARPAELLVISARTPTALKASSERLHAALCQRQDVPLSDIAYTLQKGRRAFAVRRAIVCRNPAQAIALLAAQDGTFAVSGTTRDRPWKLVFMFPGGHTQYLGMGRELYAHEPVYRDAIDRCAALFEAEFRSDVRALLYSAADPTGTIAAELARPTLNMAAVFSTEYALAQLLLAWGLRPSAVVGHSLGEYTAACVAGVLSLEDAVALISLRGKLGEQMPPSAMMTVSLPESELTPYLGDELSIAAVNSESHCVVSGSRAAVDALAAELSSKQIQHRRLAVAMGSHSIMVEPFAWRLKECAATMQLRPPAIPLVSNLSGTWMTPSEAEDPAYWARHLRHPIRFADCLKTLLSDPDYCLLEVGPGKTLTTLANLQSVMDAERLTVTTMAGAQSAEQHSDLDLLLAAVARLWCAGVPVDWEAFYKGQQRHRVPLPTYPFEGEAHVIDLPEPAPRSWAAARSLPPPFLAPAESRAVIIEAPLPRAAAPTQPEPIPVTKNEPASPPVSAALSEIWRELLGTHEIRPQDNFFMLGGSSLLAIQLRSLVKQRMQVSIPVHALIAHATFESLAQEIERIVKSTQPAAAASAIQPLSAMPRPIEAPPRHQLMVCLQAGAVGRPPLFLFQSVGGTVYTYQELTRLLGAEQPVYAFRASGMEPGEPIYTDLPVMAQYYLDEILRFHHSPFYLLGGYSAGGMIAYEIANQLLARGYRVPFVFMVDPGPIPQYARFDIQRIEDLLHIGNALEAAAPRPWQALRAALKDGSPLQEVIVKTYQAIASYKPQRSRADIVYFRARERDNVLDPHPETWWMDLCNGNFSVYNAPGNHLTMMDMPHVKYMGRIIRRYLRTYAKGG